MLITPDNFSTRTISLRRSADKILALIRSLNQGVCLTLVLIFLMFGLKSNAQISLNNRGESKSEYHELALNYGYHSFGHYHSEAKSYTQINGLWPFFGPQTEIGWKYPRKFMHIHNSIFLHYTKVYNLGLHNRFYYSVNLGGGLESFEDSETNDYHGTKEAPFFYGGSTAIGADTRMLGIHGGIYLGDIRSSDQLTGEENKSLTSGKPSFKILPKFSLRLGYIPAIAVEINCGMVSGYINGARYPIGICHLTGFGRDSGGYLKTGFGIMGGKAFGQLGFKLPIKNTIGIETNAFFNESPYVSISVIKYFGLKSFNGKFNFNV